MTSITIVSKSCPALFEVQGTQKHNKAHQALFRRIVEMAIAEINTEESQLGVECVACELVSVGIHMSMSNLSSREDATRWLEQVVDEFFTAVEAEAKRNKAM